MVWLIVVGIWVDEICVIGVNLGYFVWMMNIVFEFQVVVIRFECFDVCMLGLRDYEVVVGNFIFSFYEFLDGEMLSGLLIVLKFVFNVRSKVVTVVEQEVNYSGFFFQ